MTPTQRTIRELKNLGRKCGIVEKFNRFAGGKDSDGKAHGIRQDLFGIIDIIALDPERGVVGIQSCGSSYAEHYRKITSERYQDTLDWLSTPGARLELWGWRKIKVKRGGKAMKWEPRIKEITLSDLEGGSECFSEKTPIDDLTLADPCSTAWVGEGDDELDD